MALRPDAKFYRIKAAQRDLIAMVGGVERAGDLIDCSTTTTGRWNNKDDPTLMPLSAVWMLEGECGSPVVTRALAAMNGHRLVESETEQDLQYGDVLKRHADAVVRAAEVMQSGAIAFSDNRLTPAEALHIDQGLSALSQAIEDYRKSLANARSVGGLNIVEGGK